MLRSAHLADGEAHLAIGIGPEFWEGLQLFLDRNGHLGAAHFRSSPLSCFGTPSR